MANKTETITIRLTEQEKNHLKEIAEFYETTVSQYARKIIKEYLKEDDKKMAELLDKYDHIIVTVCKSEG